jgi:hypothetical protein
MVPDDNTKELSRRNLIVKPLRVGAVREDNQYSEVSKLINTVILAYDGGSDEIAEMYANDMAGLSEEQLDAMFSEYTPEVRAERKVTYKAMGASLCNKIKTALDHIPHPKFASYSAALSCNLERDIELLRTIKHIVGIMDKNSANLVGGYRKSRSRSHKRRQTKKVKGGRRHPNQRR